MFKKLFVLERVVECSKLVILIVSSVIFGTLIMLFLYSTPTKRLFDNARESTSLYSTQMITDWSGHAAYTELSNFTDSIMINNALYRPYKGIVKNAMLNSFIQYEGMSMQQNLVTLLTEGVNGGKSIDYSRYWHGYLAYLIPGLMFFNVGEIKVLMMIIQMLLLAMCLYEFGKINYLYLIAFIFVALFINPITTVLTFQDADIYIITMVFSLVILRKNVWLKKKERWKFLFAFNGILVAFIDFFTYPLVAFGVPLLVFCGVCGGGDKGKKTLNIIAKSSFFWLSGYAGMWTGKWVMALLLTGNNTFAEGVSSLKYRTAGIGEGITDVTYINVLNSMWNAINTPPMRVLFILAILIMGIYVVKNKYSLLIKKERVCFGIPVLIIGMFPFIYYFIVRNHAIVHPWLEYRELVVTVFAIEIFCINLVMDRESEVRRYE